MSCFKNIQFARQDIGQCWQSGMRQFMLRVMGGERPAGQSMENQQIDGRKSRGHLLTKPECFGVSHWIWQTVS